MSSAKVCLVTGGATGIGAACVREFIRQGWIVAATHFGEEQGASDLLEGLEPAAQTRLARVAVDVTDDASCRAAAATVLQRWGRIDAVVNCAGTTRFVAHDDLDALSADEFHRVYDVNLIGTFQLTRACIPALRASGAGSVVNISSIAGLRGTGSSLAYAASKGALNTMTVSMARSFAPAVRVNAIAPGFVDGGLPSRVLSVEQHDNVRARQENAAPLRRVSQPEEIAALAWFLTDRAPGVTGQVVVVDNGLQL